jgi:hypothetical protein
MNKVFETIARENFCSSGYITHPRKEQSSGWTFSPPPQSPFFTTNAVRDAIQRRERAQIKAQRKPNFIQNCLNVLLHR